MPEAGRGPPSLDQAALGQGSAVILTERRTGGLSCWMKENPRHWSGSTAYEDTTAGGTVRKR